MSAPALVIFDCDGTLVDTEDLSAAAYTDALRLHGIYLSPAEFRARFMGVTLRDIAASLEQQHACTLPFDALHAFYMAAMERDLGQGMKVLPESVAAVRALAARVKVAVGSNGVRSLVLAEVAQGGYGDVFSEDRIFTANQVARPKPHPDIYLYAAERMGVAAIDCVVIEDSLAGARAGVAAGMRVIGYTGFAHDAASACQTLEAAGCFKVINDLSQLEALVL